MCRVHKDLCQRCCSNTQEWELLSTCHNISYSHLPFVGETSLLFAVNWSLWDNTRQRIRFRKFIANSSRSRFDGAAFTYWWSQPHWHDRRLSNWHTASGHASKCSKKTVRHRRWRRRRRKSATNGLLIYSPSRTRYSLLHSQLHNHGSWPSSYSSSPSAAASLANINKTNLSTCKCSLSELSSLSPSFWTVHSSAVQVDYMVKGVSMEEVK